MDILDVARFGQNLYVHCSPTNSDWKHAPIMLSGRSDSRKKMLHSVAMAGKSIIASLISRIRSAVNHFPPGIIDITPVNNDSEPLTFGYCVICRPLKFRLSNPASETIADGSHSRAGNPVIGLAVFLVASLSPAMPLPRSKIRQSKGIKERIQCLRHGRTLANSQFEKLGNIEKPKVWNRNMRIQLYYRPSRVCGFLQENTMRSPEQIFLDSNLPDKFSDLDVREHLDDHILFFPQRSEEVMNVKFSRRPFVCFGSRGSYLWLLLVG